MSSFTNIKSTLFTTSLRTTEHSDNKGSAKSVALNHSADVLLHALATQGFPAYNMFLYSHKSNISHEDSECNLY